MDARKLIFFPDVQPTYQENVIALRQSKALAGSHAATISTPTPDTSKFIRVETRA